LASEETSRTLAESTPNIVPRLLAEPPKPLACLLFRLMALPANGKTLPVVPVAPEEGSVTENEIGMLQTGNIRGAIGPRAQTGDEMKTRRKTRP
jgi:hypothetical protein